MWIMFLVFAAPVILFGISDLRQDVRAGSWKTVTAYLALATLGLALLVCVMKGVPLPSQSDMITAIVRRVFPPLE